MIEMKAIHQEFCKRNKIRYVAKNMTKDLSWNCMAVATVLADLLKAQGKQARAVYGLYHGTCVGRNHPFYRHGWVVMGRDVLDPTRFVFEGEKPYLFEGKLAEQPEYDEGMRIARSANRKPFPIPGGGKVVPIQWSESTSLFLRDLIYAHTTDIFISDFSNLNYFQLMWIANTDYLALGEYIDEIYTKLLANNLSVLIPSDYVDWWEANRKKES
jgi:hypothetical protein